MRPMSRSEEPSTSAREASRDLPDSFRGHANIDAETVFNKWLDWANDQVIKRMNEHGETFQQATQALLAQWQDDG